jgi:hypothetical protein
MMMMPCDWCSTLTGNPCTTFEGYRSFVVAHLPDLLTLDGIPVTKSEILEGKQDLLAITEVTLVAVAMPLLMSARLMHTKEHL